MRMTNSPGTMRPQVEVQSGGDGIVVGEVAGGMLCSRQR